MLSYIRFASKDSLHPSEWSDIKIKDNVEMYSDVLIVSPEILEYLAMLDNAVELTEHEAGRVIEFTTSNEDFWKV